MIIKCDECQSPNIGFVNNDWLCLECGEKVDTIPKSMFWKGKAKDFPGVREVIKQNGSK